MAHFCAHLALNVPFLHTKAEQAKADGVGSLWIFDVGSKELFEF